MLDLDSVRCWQAQIGKIHGTASTVWLTDGNLGQMTWSLAHSGNRTDPLLWDVIVVVWSTGGMLIGLLLWCCRRNSSTQENAMVNCSVQVFAGESRSSIESWCPRSDDRRSRERKFSTQDGDFVRRSLSTNWPCYIPVKAIQGYSLSDNLPLPLC